jgi:hypothetical protein
VDLHHLDYGNLGGEDHDQLIPVCRRHHDRIHEAWEATAHVRRLGRRTATLALIAEMQKQLAVDRGTCDRINYPSSGVPFRNT